MDLGLGNLTQLKTHLLNEALRSSSAYDAALAALGRGVAARFEQVCGRKFARLAGATYVAPACDREIVVDRYPIEAITSIALRESLADGYVDQGDVDDLVENISEAAGLITFGAALSTLTSARLRVTFTGGYWYPTAAARTVVSGSASLASGASSAFVTFEHAFAAVPVVGLTLQAPEGGALIDVSAQAITAEGFTIALAAPTGASGYTVSWIAADPSDEVDATTFQTGTAALTVAAESKAITFGTAFAAAPRVFVNLVGPDGGLIISVQPTLVTTAGFTVPIAFPIPATGYSLTWFALAADATSSAESLPAGATALPADLSLAWLTQCALVWASVDALGTGLSDAAAKAATVAALGKLTLAPEVEATLRTYVRFVP